jgi:hypothetical protein
MKTDLCHCGKLKDNRSKQCRYCSDLEASQRPCKRCGRVNTEFRKKKDGRRRSPCRKCEAELAKKWRKENPEEHKRRKKQWEIKYPEKHRRGVMRRTWRRLGLDPNDIEKKLSNHKGGCQICGDLQPEYYQFLSVDHCHSTGKFRGFLCPNCNSALGLFKDKPELLIRAADYLNTFRAQAII